MDVTFASAGTGAVQGAPASDGAVLVGMERGLDLSGHRSRQVDPAMAGPETIFLAMTAPHVAALQRVLPGDARVFLLDEYASLGATRRSIADPFGGDLAGYRGVADELEAIIPLVIDRVAQESRAEPD